MEFWCMTMVKVNRVHVETDLCYISSVIRGHPMGRARSFLRPRERVS